MTSSIDTVIHFGAGHCSELDTYLGQNINRILLVEADPDLAEDLALRTTGFTNVKVTHAAVSDTEGPAILHRFNLPEVNSLHEPAGPLTRLFPGLRLLEKLQVNTVNLVSLIRPLDLQQNQANLLIIDLPGNELPVIEALHQEGQLQTFRYLKLYCGREPLYTDSTPANELLAWLEKQGFDQDTEDSGTDPDRPVFLLKRNDFLLRYQDLQQQLITLAREKNEAVMLAASHKRQAEDNQHKQEQTLKERDEQARLAEQRQAAINQSSDERTKLIESHATKVNELLGTIEEKNRLLNDKEARLQQLTKERDEQTKLAEERLAMIEKMSKDHEDQSWRQHQLDEELVKAEAQIKLISDILIREKAF